METNPNAAMNTYNVAVVALKKFCEEQTELEAYILTDEYPVRVQFIPCSQMSLFDDENVDENGEVGELTVTVGLTSDVKSTLKFKMDSQILKKLIKLAESIGRLYYQAYREQQGAKATAKRPDYEGDGYDESGELIYDIAKCPECGHEFEYDINDWGSAFCPDCGQKLDWTPAPDEPDESEESEYDAAFKKLRELCDANADHSTEKERR